MTRRGESPERGFMKKKHYRLGFDYEKHRDVIESIEEVSRPLMGEYIAAAIRLLKKTNIAEIHNGNKGASDTQPEPEGMKTEDSKGSGGIDFKNAFSF